jgi:WD40 repeat protein
MGGEVIVMNSVGKLTFKPHGMNRVTCGRFSPDGQMFATFGRDIAVCFFRRIGDGKVWTPLPNATVRCEKEISSFCWISDSLVAIAETENCMIGLYRVEDTGRAKIGELCMNQSINDPRTLSTMLTMTYFTSSRLLAGCTARNSVLLFRLPECISTSTNRMNVIVCPIKKYYGMSIGIYDFPAISFSEDGSFLLVTSGEEIIVFEIKTCHKVFAIPGSSNKPIRAISANGDILATVSFDGSMYIIT